MICDNENIPWRVTGPFLHGCLHIVSFVCLFVYLHVSFLLPLLLILLLLSLLLLFCWRFVVIALISVLRLDYKIGHRKSFWYSPFLIHDYDYDSTTDEMYSLRSCSIGINRFWLVCLSFFAFYWLGEDRSRLLNQLFQVASSQVETVENYVSIICVISSQTGVAAWQPKTVGKVFYWETLPSSTRLIPLEHDRSLREVLFKNVMLKQEITGSGPLSVCPKIT